MPSTAASSLATLLPEPLRVGAPDVAGALAVFSLFGGPPRLEYRSFAEAAAVGATVSELPGGASVNDLRVTNPTDLPVLLYEGEELVGAQQDRTVDHAVMVPAGATMTVAVSCVERGRWDATRHDEAFGHAGRAAFPELRRVKSRHMRERLAAGLQARADQAEVWGTVSRKAARLAASSPTDAMAGIYDDRREAVEALEAAVARRDGQVGALVALGGAFAVVDVVSRSDVFAALHAPLVRGYALDALELPEAAQAPAVAAAQAFASAVFELAARRAPAAGLGEAVHVEGAAAAGTGLVVDGELVQLSAYAGEDEPRATGSIRRPSRRR